ncbi:MAG: CHASE2 domain-containing protein [Leptolyngbyaceae cyanobacterium]
MTKLVFLKIGAGSLEAGFPVILQMGNEGAQPTIEVTAAFPAALDLWKAYQRWQVSYHRLGIPYRLEAKTGYVTNVSVIGDCRELAQAFGDRFNQWFQSTEFQPIREKLLAQLSPTEPIRLIIQTQTAELRRLPWHVLSFFDAYPQADVALAAPTFELIDQQPVPSDSIRVLAILGDATALDVAQDEALLKDLPHAEIHFLQEPSYQQLNDTLWDEQGWDILFFAGHSLTDVSASLATGAIAINPTETLSMDQLKYGLRTARQRGLCIAIFNSCDGLGLADGLAELNIPDIIVMREPIPDVVAHAFLKAFLRAFARGLPLYLAIREARERLQGLENDYPCATWLPTLCQNPATMPPTWQSLHQRRSPVAPLILPVPVPPVAPVPSKTSPHLTLSFLTQPTIVTLGASLIIAVLMIVFRFLGGLQAWELKGYDWLLNLRPVAERDRRIVVIEVSADHVEESVTLSNDMLNRLLIALETYQPSLIGLDLYRDFSVRPDHEELADRLGSTENLVAICKGSDEAIAIRGTAPSPDMPVAQIGFSDFLLDADGVLRRQLVAMTPEVDSPCQANYAFSSQLALRYLVATGHSPEFWTDEGLLQLGDTIVPPLDRRIGPYQTIDAAGYQLLLNYRPIANNQSLAETVALEDVLEQRLPPDALLNKIVLIGRTDRDSEDFYTLVGSAPQQADAMLPGVMLHAHMISHLLTIADSTSPAGVALRHRPSLKMWSEWRNMGWIILWSLLAGSMTLLNRGRSPQSSAQRPSKILLCLVSAEVTLIGLCWLLLVNFELWVPLMPPAIAIAAVIVIVNCFKMRRSRMISPSDIISLVDIPMSKHND